MLEKIDRVEITNFAEIGGVVYYFLDVYLKHHTNRIPTNKRLEASRSDRPDYTIQKRFSDFANLRYQVWSYAQRSHDGGSACRYCSKNMDFLVTSFSQPRLFIKLFVKSKKTRSRLLAKGINKYIELAIGKKAEPRQRYYTCHGYMMIPALVERFLRDEDSTALINSAAFVRLAISCHIVCDAETSETRPASPAGKPGERTLLVPDLQPLRMWPCRYAKAADSLGFLKTIDHLEVHETVKTKGKLFYVVAVYLKNPEIRIPTGRTSATRSSYSHKSSVELLGHRESITEPLQTQPAAADLNEPDYLVEKEFSEFIKLRYNIWVHAQQPRPSSGCIYCDDITSYVGSSSKRPSSLMEKIWATKSRRKELMEVYLNRMVALAIGRGGDGQRSPHCHGFDHIPYRLVRFLKKAGEINRLC
ncbi:hypothetical protein BBJ29_004906 [Phytophthora kernoviae]|uniref:PX domain-containing protein n=1 Tax=Phytophthora kernoviae TaxID=325452 RepID=A0A3F2RLS8_9STRA|nr:hypothetical protein BBJ29_004906 [Phytophthora kernoviae]RLN60020.1 hypothetical protein BBP00_00006197 [Phytophthora kernoviae]